MITIVIGLIFVFFLSPSDYQQGSMVRIMYIHVPAAWLSLMTFFIMTIYSIVGLAFRIPFGFIINTAIAPIGAVFTLICLITGSLWGKPMWGTWWGGDARLTSVLILLFLYLGYMALWQAIEDNQKAAKAAAVLALVGAVNVPIIKFSVDWWNTLHQPASVMRLDGPSIHPSMLWPLLIMGLAFMVYFVTLLLARIRMELNLRRIRVLRLAERSS